MRSGLPVFLVEGTHEARRRRVGEQNELVRVVPKVLVGVIRAAMKVKLTARIARDPVIGREHLGAESADVESHRTAHCHGCFSPSAWEPINQRSVQAPRRSARPVAA